MRRLALDLARYKARRHELPSVKKRAFTADELLMLLFRVMHDRLKEFPRVEVDHAELLRQ